MADPKVLEAHFAELYKKGCLNCGKNLRLPIHQLYCDDCCRTCMNCKGYVSSKLRVNCASCDPIGVSICYRCRVTRVVDTRWCGKCAREMEKLLAKDERNVYGGKVEDFWSTVREVVNDTTLCVKRGEILRRLTIIAMKKEEQRLKEQGIDVDLVSKVGGPSTRECESWVAESDGLFGIPWDNEHYEDTKENLQKALAIINEESAPSIPYTKGLLFEFRDLKKSVRDAIGQKVLLEIEMEKEKSEIEKVKEENKILREELSRLRNDERKKLKKRLESLYGNSKSITVEEVLELKGEAKLATREAELAKATVVRLEKKMSELRGENERLKVWVRR